MLASSANFSAMIAGSDMTVTAKVTLTLPAPAAIYDDVTLTLESLSIDAQTTSDMPAGTRLQVGYPSISADITLSGLVDSTDETKTIGWLFGPWQTTSPLYRQSVLYSPVTIDVGLYPVAAAGVPELMRKFTGYIDDITVNTDGTVSLSCLDNRNKLRAIPGTPPTVIAPPANNGLTSEAAVDSILYTSTGGAIGTRPATRPNCIFNAGMRTTLVPDVGSLPQGGTNFTPVFIPGAFGSALGGFPVGAAASYTLAAPAGSTFFVEYWVQGGSAWGLQIAPTSLGPPPTEGVIVVFDGSNFRLAFGANMTNVYTAPDKIVSAPFTGVGYVSMAFTQTPGSAAYSGSFRVNGTSTAFSGTFASARTSTAWDTLALVNPTTGLLSLEAVQISNETAPVTNFGFAPTADLDPSLDTLAAVPAYSGDPWQVIQQIADAELAVAGFDESGVFRFRNRQTLRSGVSVRTLTSANSLVALGAQTSATSLVNRVKVTTSAWSFSSSRTLVWSLPAAKRIARKSTVTIAVDLADTLAGQINGGFAGVLTNGESTTAGNFRYRASTDQAGTTEARFGQLSITAVQVDSSHINIIVKNSGTADSWLVSPSNYTDMPAGTPSVWLGGILATNATGTVADTQWPPVDPDGTGGAATSIPGEIAYEISSNPWVQDDDTGALLADAVLGDLCQARPSLTNVSIVPDPRLQLCDRVLLQDPDVTNLNEYAVIFGWNIQMSADGFDMTIDARAVAAPGNWILGVTGRTELSTTTNL